MPDRRRAAAQAPGGAVSLDGAAWRALFEAAPAPYLVLLPDAPRFTIVAVSDAYLRATMTVRDGPGAILGRGLFEVFPDPPDDPAATGTRNLRASLERAIATRAPDTMAVQHYDIRRPDGSWEERHWSPINTPVLDRASGRVTHLIHRVEDVTDLVRLTQRESEHAAQAAGLERRTLELQAELVRRAQDLQAANDRLRAAYARAVAALGPAPAFDAANTDAPALGPAADEGAPARPSDAAGELAAVTAALERTTAALIDRTAEAQASERRFRATFEQAAVGIAHVALDGHWLRVNERLCEITGYPRAELLGLTFQDITHPDDVGADLEQARRLLAGDVQTYSTEKRYVRRDGSAVWVNVTVSLVRREDGAPDYFISVVEDITARRRAEVARAQLAAIVESSDDAIISISLDDGTILNWNAAAERLFGRTAAEAIGWPITVIVPTELHGEEAQILERLRGGEHINHYQTIRLRKDGTRFPVSLSISPLRDASGRVTVAAKIARDITAEKRAEAERERLLEAERAARAEAETASRAKTEFLAVMSHELRTPLNAIAGYTQLLNMGIRGPVTEAQRQDLERIQRSQQHLLSVIDGVLTFAKVEVGQMTYHLEELPVGEALVGLELFLAPTLRAKGVQLEIEEGSCRALVRVDREKLRQVLLNLLSNAVKFTPPSGRVRLECHEGPDEVVLRVYDTGIGIPADKLEAIFEPFRQVHMGLTREHGGTGLGLAISREFARAMGGDITALSVLGQGSTFSVRLPRARESASRAENVGPC